MATEDPIDAEILAVDETPTEALARREALAQAGRNPAALSITIATPTGEHYRAYVRQDLAPYDPHELWIGAYNKTHSKPAIEEFEPAWNWSDEVRAQMGLGMRPKSRLRLPSTALDSPMLVQERIGLARLEQRGQAHVAKILIRSDIDRAYVSHLTIGTRHGGILTAVQLDEPLRVLGGHHLQFGIVLGAVPRLDGHDTRQRVVGEVAGGSDQP